MYRSEIGKYLSTRKQASAIGDEGVSKTGKRGIVEHFLHGFLCVPPANYRQIGFVTHWCILLICSSPIVEPFFLGVNNRVSHFSTFFKNWYATNGSPLWETSIDTTKFFGQFGHHLELAPEQHILQRDLTKNTKEISVYHFFPFNFKFSFCEMSCKCIDQFVWLIRLFWYPYWHSLWHFMSFYKFRKMP